jgi:hypothetical protein
VPRTATQQNLATEAIDRALDQLEWPKLEGKSVLVAIGPPGDAVDTEYLRIAVEVEIAERGGRVVEDSDEADFVAALLVGAVGLDISERFMGVQGSGGGFIPVTIPELSLYKNTRTEGFAKAELAILDPREGGVLFHSGPVQGTTYLRARTYLLFIRTKKTDTSRLD